MYDASNPNRKTFAVHRKVDTGPLHLNYNEVKAACDGIASAFWSQGSKAFEINDRVRIDVVVDVKPGSRRPTNGQNRPATATVIVYAKGTYFAAKTPGNSRDVYRERGYYAHIWQQQASKPLRPGWDGEALWALIEPILRDPRAGTAVYEAALLTRICDTYEWLQKDHPAHWQALCDVFDNLADGDLSGVFWNPADWNASVRVGIVHTYWGIVQSYLAVAGLRPPADFDAASVFAKLAPFAQAVAEVAQHQIEQAEKERAAAELAAFFAAQRAADDAPPPAASDGDHALSPVPAPAPSVRLDGSTESLEELFAI